MTVLIIIILSVAVLAAVALALVRPTLAPGGTGLRRRFGPEYERAVARHQGDTKAAHRELGNRLRRHRRFRPAALPPGAHERYRSRWARAQEQFVDSPAGAIAEADQLINQLIRERGYPSDGYGEQLAAVSVHHPRDVDGYRQVHLLAGREEPGRDAERTEDLRAALLAARHLFDALLDERPEAAATAAPGAGAPIAASGTGAGSES
ncbi:hypothetical protein SAMN06297387_11366 [Streptomyces zhaozhouensis]|uniref:Secreted protein n=1 Tax=Streptomyces zhaozhouensis TaxID=1300267 RepID=A0A286DZ20_9ACTN|nr:hypothetical protein [Streptomyces zhaozhouensis]SOD63907.1 hypothetical protein SAMN06297387_11366 [Streptomyces zhaozhouensis]